MRKYTANIITGCRILCSILLMFFPVFSAQFYFTYLFCGLSDMVDGTVARKTNSCSKFGARFDTAADFMFVIIDMMKILPLIHISRWTGIWIVIIAAIKMVNIISGFICKKKLISMHTILNKVTGFLLFLLPLALPFVEIQYSAVVICAIATFAAIQEGHYIRTGQEIV